jgi:hypothetical protein
MKYDRRGRIEAVFYYLFFFPISFRNKFRAETNPKSDEFELKIIRLEICGKENLT